MSTYLAHKFVRMHQPPQHCCLNGACICLSVCLADWLAWANGNLLQQYTSQNYNVRFRLRFPILDYFVSSCHYNCFPWLLLVCVCVSTELGTTRL